MPNVSYVYPNLSKFHKRNGPIRGGLLERWIQAQKANCEYVEVPATLIKNMTEEKITGLEIGDFLVDELSGKRVTNTTLLLLSCIDQ